jgi:hypothetical protein
VNVPPERKGAHASKASGRARAVPAGKRDAITLTRRFPKTKRRGRIYSVVYGIRSRDAKVFHYVGKTNSAKLRLMGHLSFAKKAIGIGASSIFQDWLVRASGEKEVVILEEIRSAHGAHAREVVWIRRLASAGHPLLNLHHHPDPPGKFRCRTPPCKTITFSSRRAADQHAKGYRHQVEKCSLAAWPFAIDPDAPRQPKPFKPPRKRLFYAGVECGECGEPIPSRDFFAFEVSHFNKDGSAYRVCTTCDYNEAQFEATDESGYDSVFTD